MGKDRHGKRVKGSVQSLNFLDVLRAEKVPSTDGEPIKKTKKTKRAGGIGFYA